MTTELFLGSLTILTLVGIIIVALTANDRISRSGNSHRDGVPANKRRGSNSDR